MSAKVLSREEMVKVIAGGGGVIYNGRIITRVDRLPSEAELAKGDPEKEAATLAEIEKQIAELQAQKALLVREDAPVEVPAGQPVVEATEAPKAKK